MKLRNLSIISAIHFFRLIYRSVLFFLLLAAYISYRVHAGDPLLSILETRPAIIRIIWIVFVLEMILRFFPSRFESPGCQKQFKRNYIKTGDTVIAVEDNNATVLTAIIWITFNGIFGALHMAGILDDGIMILLCSAYSICDLICILFFCPFQSWLLKNKCCVACRIYNWDYAMMFTPLFFVKSPYSWSLLALSIALLLRWELTFFLHPERFSEKTNAYLTCANCPEKLCSHKKQLKRLQKQIREYTARRLKKLT